MSHDLFKDHYVGGWAHGVFNEYLGRRFVAKALLGVEATACVSSLLSVCVVCYGGFH